MIVVPTAPMNPFALVASQVVTPRAFDNQILVADVNRIRREGNLVYCGGSSIVARQGRDPACADRDEALLVGRIDRAVRQAARNPALRAAAEKP